MFDLNLGVAECRIEEREHNRSICSLSIFSGVAPGGPEYAGENPVTQTMVGWQSLAYCTGLKIMEGIRLDEEH